jgi:chromosomal replication initiation ATPase DnaA
MGLPRIYGRARTLKERAAEFSPDVEVIHDHVRDRARAAFITSMVAMSSRVPAREIVAASRNHAAAAHARQVAMYMAYVGYAWSLSRVATAFGRDRTTVSYACHRIEDMRDDPAFDAYLGDMETCLRAAPEEVAA